MIIIMSATCITLDEMAKNFENFLLHRIILLPLALWFSFKVAFYEDDFSKNFINFVKVTKKCGNVEECRDTGLIERTRKR